RDHRRNLREGFAFDFHRTKLSCILNRLFFNLFAKPNEQNDACIKSAMARKGGCEETNPLTETMQECMQKILFFYRQ
ncbi:MAG: hypothetical protein IJ832_01345, partial [Bacteroidaceae bacterium]|nr:hypothetical protein [Bacteroidaceae bacterium]